MLIKLENDVRQHIRVEQQLKLHIEQVQQSADDVQKSRDDQIEKYKDHYSKKCQSFEMQIQKMQKLHSVEMARVNSECLEREEKLVQKLNALESDLSTLKQTHL